MPRGQIKQEPAGTGVPVDLALDREQQFGDALDLVDQHQPVVADEPAGVRLCCLPDRLVVEVELA
jgi:hypothetical protein